MGFKVASFIALVVTVTAEIYHPSYYQDSSTYVTEGSLSVVDSVDGYEAVIGKESLPVVYNPQSYIESEGSPWNYLIPAVANSESSVFTNYPASEKVLPLAAPWTHEVPVAYSTSATPSTSTNQEIPFGYVAPVAKISAPPGYKIL